MNTKGVEDGMSDSIPTSEARDWTKPHLKALNYINNCELDSVPISIEKLREFLDVPDAPDWYEGSEEQKIVQGSGDSLPMCPHGFDVGCPVCGFHAFMPAAVPVEERTAMLEGLLREHMAAYICDTNNLHNRSKIALLLAAPIPEERTAEMELLMASLRASAGHALGVAADHGINPDCFPVALATAPNILKLLDHIEGNPQ